MSRNLLLHLGISTVLGIGVAFSAGSVACAADEPPKLVSLGLSAATAMTSQKDVVKGLKQAAADEYIDWLWQAVGGTEKLMTQNAEAEIPVVKDKIMKIVSTVQAIEKVSIAMTEGKYDDAAIAAIDEAVGKLNHPLVAVTWEMAKLTYESHKLVLSTGAERDIEAMYGIVANDRRIMGVIDPKSDSPAQISVNAQTADYFFNKYIVTDGSARGLMKSYVTTHLGEEWPEENWASYTKSWLAVGSGVDTAENAEIEALAGEWRNKARGWIAQLLNEANKEAKVAWGQARLRQQMAAFKKFSDRVGHFYNNDLDRMLKEFLSIKANREAEAELSKLPALSQAAYKVLEDKINKMEDADLNLASSWELEIDQWQLKCLSAYSKMLQVNEALSKTLLTERQIWLKLTETLNKKVQQKKGQVFTGLVEDIYPDREYSSHPSEQTRKTNDEAYEARAKGFYNELFAKLFVEFDWLATEKNIELMNIDGEKKTEKLIADPKTIVEILVKSLNVGDFKGAEGIAEFWKKDVQDALNMHFGEIQKQIEKVQAVVPESLTQALAANNKAEEDGRKLMADVYAEEHVNQDKSKEIRRKYSGFWGVDWTSLLADPEYQALSALNQALEEKLRAFWNTTEFPARKKYETEKYGWEQATRMPLQVLSRMRGIEDLLYQDILRQMEDAISAFSGLKAVRQEQYDLYKAKCEAILKDLPVPGSDDSWMPASEMERAEAGSYTFMSKNKTSRPAKAVNITQTLSDISTGDSIKGVADALLAYANTIESKEPIWVKAMAAFAKLEVVNGNDLAQIKVLVDRDFDPEIYRKKIKEAIVYVGKVREMKDKMRTAAKKAETDQMNRERDRESVSAQSMMVGSYFSGLQEKGLIKWGDNDYQIVLPGAGREGMIRIEKPVAHYATREELQKLGQPVRDAWKKMQAVAFARKNAPEDVAKWEEILNMVSIPAAKGENFIAPNYDLPIYKSDLQKAWGLVAKLKGSSESYGETMDEVAKLVPGLMQVATVVEKERDVNQAKLYGMTVEEYYTKLNKTPKPVLNYILSDAARGIMDAKDAQHELLGLYAKIAQRIDVLHGEAIDHAAELKRKEAAASQEELRKINEIESSRQQKESAENVKATNPLLYYGYELLDPRVNTYSVANVSGDVVVTRDKLVGGQLEITARLNHIDHAKTMLMSEDGGRTWKQINVSQDIRYAFTPIPNKSYQPILKIKTDDMLDVGISLLDGGRIVYQDGDFSQEVLKAVQGIADAYERQDFGAFSSIIARDFLGNKATLEEGVRFDFDMFMDIRLKLYVDRIDQRGDSFAVETRWDKSQTPRKTGEIQKTSGRTTMMLVMEDSQLKLRNLRGNLLYATMSPDIAQSSGLKSSVVDQIRVAQQERDSTTQPGAGTSESSEPLQVYSSTLHDDYATGAPTVDESIDFSSQNVLPGGAGDVMLEINGLWAIGSAGIKEVSTGFQATTTADGVTAGDRNVSGLATGNVYIFLTSDGYYGKLEVLSWVATDVDSDMHMDHSTVQFRYAVQMDGTTNIATQ